MTDKFIVCTSENYSNNRGMHLSGELNESHTKIFDARFCSRQSAEQIHGDKESKVLVRHKQM